MLFPARSVESVVRGDVRFAPPELWLGDVFSEAVFAAPDGRAGEVFAFAPAALGFAAPTSPTALPATPTDNATKSESAENDNECFISSPGFIALFQSR